MSAPSPALVELAGAYRVWTSFTDWRGDTVQVSAETLEAVLGALGADTADPDAALRAHADAPWRRMLPPCVVVIEGRPGTVLVHVPHGAPATATVLFEDGGELDLRQVRHDTAPREIDGELVGEAAFALPEDLPLGYHLIRATTTGAEVTGAEVTGAEATGADAAAATATAALIVTPRWLGVPERLADRRVWGLAAQLYSIRSEESWGVGDLADLRTLSTFAGAELGAAFALVNPLQAAEPVAPLEPSPYLPSSRRFVAPLYLRVEDVPEYAVLPPEDRAEVDALGAAVRARAVATDAIERDPAWTAKRAALRLLFEARRTAEREARFAAFVQREGPALREFATWSALAIEHGSDARAWPEPLRDSASAAVAEYAAQHEHEVAFQCWLQWQLDQQLGSTQDAALNAGMPIGTMHDLAVGVHPGGADAWRMRDAYAPTMSVGAPPDPFNQQGQDWGQPPWRPDALAELAYRPFRDIIAAVLRHAGGVRVDHIIGLFRLWWIPRGRAAQQGAYVYYDHEALIGILALEAHRAGAVVVGEDLGVVDPNARTYLRERGILGTSILWFERDGGAPLPAERWREWCLATVTTHDLPPTAAYLEGEHVRLQHRLGLLTGSLEDDLAEDAAERATWLAELRSRGLGTEGTEETVESLHRYLALTPARLVGVTLTDAVGDRRTQNQPGTVSEYPNWRVPLSGPDGVPLALEDVLASQRLRRLARAVTRALEREDPGHEPPEGLA